MAIAARYSLLYCSLWLNKKVYSAAKDKDAGNVF